MSIRAFVPPYLLSRLAEHTRDEHVRGCARETLELDQQFRARRGEVDRAAARLADSARRTIYTADNTDQLPGREVRAEGDEPSGDAAVDEAYDGTGDAWALFHDAYGRDSYDDAGHRIDATVHYRRSYDNAFWDGQRLVFGDGDGRVFERFTKAPDVIAHEFTHGVTQHTAALAYENQPGALNESVSDVFAALTVQRARGQSAGEASWLIGAGLFTPDVNADALRSMKEPGTAYDDPLIGKDPQPAHMDDYVETTDDNGGVHINSGIPNHAFYLAATAIGGNAWEAAGAIWYATLTDERLGSRPDFARFAALTVDAAARLHAADSPQATAVREAWRSVGVEPADLAQPDAERAGGEDLRITVRRSGGVAGLAHERTVALATSPRRAQLERLLDRVDLNQLGRSQPRPDAYVYAIEIDGQHITVNEHDLTPELASLVELVLESG